MISRAWGNPVIHKKVCKIKLTVKFGFVYSFFNVYLLC